MARKGNVTSLANLSKEALVVGLTRNGANPGNITAVEFVAADLSKKGLRRQRRRPADPGRGRARVRRRGDHTAGQGTRTAEAPREVLVVRSRSRDPMDHSLADRPRRADPAPDLADRLRTATAGAHRAVEQAPFIAALLRGEASRADYARLLAALLAIYGALEAGLERHRGDPRLAWIDLAAVRRVPALTRDLAVFAPEGPPPPAPAALAYVARLRSLADEAPALLVGHAYTRYLGDLYGGQILRRVVARTFDLSEQTGVEFYAFPGDLAALRQAFRAGLARVPADEPLTSAIVDEACEAFARHGVLFAELAAAV